MTVTPIRTTADLRHFLTQAPRGARRSYFSGRLARARFIHQITPEPVRSLDMEIAIALADDMMAAASVGLVRLFQTPRIDGEGFDYWAEKVRNPVKEAA